MELLEDEGGKTVLKLLLNDKSSSLKLCAATHHGGTGYAAW